jgi:hypothetical protein
MSDDEKFENIDTYKVDAFGCDPDDIDEYGDAIIMRSRRFAAPASDQLMKPISMVLEMG